MDDLLDLIFTKRKRLQEYEKYKNWISTGKMVMDSWRTEERDAALLEKELEELMTNPEVAYEE